VADIVASHRTFSGQFADTRHRFILINSGEDRSLANIKGRQPPGALESRSAADTQCDLNRQAPIGHSASDPVGVLRPGLGTAFPPRLTAPGM